MSCSAQGDPFTVPPSHIRSERSSDFAAAPHPPSLWPSVRLQLAIPRLRMARGRRWETCVLVAWVCSDSVFTSSGLRADRASEGVFCRLEAVDARWWYRYANCPFNSKLACDVPSMNTGNVFHVASAV